MFKTQKETLRRKDPGKARIKSMKVEKSIDLLLKPWNCNHRHHGFQRYRAAWTPWLGLSRTF
ncbi:unnamed protein product, partial [Larinioides sclopetarius]